MIMRVKDVIMMTIDGIRVSNVINTRICNDNPYSEPLSLDVIKVNAGDSAAYTVDATRSKLIADAKRSNCLQHAFNLKLAIATMDPKPSKSRNF